MGCADMSHVDGYGSGSSAYDLENCVAMEGHLRVTVLKGLAATSQLMQVEVDKESLVYELMIRIWKERKQHWRRQRILFEGQILEESKRWSQLTVEASIEVQLLHCDHSQLGLIEDREKLMALVRCNGEALAYASAELKADKDIVRAAVNNDPEALGQASKAVRQDREIVELAMAKNPEAFKFASRLLRDTRSLALRAVEANPSLILFCHQRLLKDKDFMTACVQMKPSLVEHARVTLDFETYLAAVEQDGMVLQHICKPRGARLMPDIGRDERLVTAAVRQNGMALAFAPPDLVKKLALEAVNQDLRAIRFVASKQVVLGVVKLVPSALKHAIWEFHEDVEVVEAAYSADPQALAYCGTLAALAMLEAHGPEVLRFLKPSLQTNQQVLEKLASLQR